MELLYSMKVWRRHLRRRGAPWNTTFQVFLELKYELAQSARMVCESLLVTLNICRKFGRRISIPSWATVCHPQKVSLRSSRDTVFECVKKLFYDITDYPKALFPTRNGRNRAELRFIDRLLGHFWSINNSLESGNQELKLPPSERALNFVRVCEFSSLFIDGEKSYNHLNTRNYPLSWTISQWKWRELYYRNRPLSSDEAWFLLFAEE